MSYKVFFYDATEYDRYEDRLNKLSQEGINPIEMSFLSTFEKNDKHYFYTVDVLKEEKTYPKKLVRSHLISLYDRYDFRYVGSYGRMIFFRSSSMKKLPKGREEIRKNYVENIWTTYLSTVFIFLAVVVFTIGYTVMKHDIRHLLTDGEIIFQFLVPIFFFGLALFNLSGAMRSFQFKAKKTRTVTPFKSIGLICIALAIVSTVVGCVLDYTQRGNNPLDSSILTLEQIGLPSKKEGDYSYSKSMMVEATSYLDLNDDEDLLFSVVYDVKRNPEKYFETFKEEYLTGEFKEVEKNVFVYKLETDNDSMIALKGNKIIEITSSVNLLEDNKYIRILDFYK